MPDLARVFDSKKFMWDGEIYNSAAEADAKEAVYKKDNFETHLLEEDSKFLVYTRRVVTQIVIEGSPPA